MITEGNVITVAESWWGVVFRVLAGYGTLYHIKYFTNHAAFVLSGSTSY